MSGKKILAGIFVVVILLKLIVGLTNRGPWIGLTNGRFGKASLSLMIWAVVAAAVLLRNFLDKK